MSDNWYYEAGGRRHGPMSLPELQADLQSADLQDVFVWCDHYDDWKDAADVPELKPQPRRSPQADARPAPGKKSPSKWKAFGWYALTIGVGLPLSGLTRALGPIFWIPSLHIAITWLILAKCKVNGAILPMLAILIGHTSWMLVGFSAVYVAEGMTDEVLYFGLDLIIVAGLSIWTIARLSIPSVVGIMLYQAAVLGNMALNLGGGELQVSPAAFAMHTVLRVVDMAAAIYAIVVIIRLRRQKPAATS